MIKIELHKAASIEMETWLWEHQAGFVSETNFDTGRLFEWITSVHLQTEEDLVAFRLKFGI